VSGSRIVFRVDTSAFDRPLLALQQLAESGRLTKRSRKAFAKLLARDEDLFVLSQRDHDPARADETVVVFEPSQRLLGLLAAFGAGDAEGLSLGHSDLSVGCVDSTTGERVAGGVDDAPGGEGLPLTARDLIAEPVQ
jgi:hypothetical protein